jgi:uncharacterized phiE125 gp8 family phage protein
MYKLITGPTIEPVSLTEIKSHIRLISSPSQDRTPVPCVVPGSYSIGEVTGEWIDVSGFNSYIEVQSIKNEETATLDLVIQESNNPSDATETQDYYIFAQITTENDGKFYIKDYDGGKSHIRVVGTVAEAAVSFGVNVIKDSPVCAEDAWLTETREMVREEAETYQGRAFLTQAWQLTLDGWPRDEYGHYKNFIELEKAPVQSVTSVKYYDTAGTEHTLDSSKYYLDLDRFYPRIVLNYGESWPGTILRESGGIVIEFVAGYQTVDDFKAENKSAHRWMLTVIKKLYDDRSLTMDDISYRALDWGRRRGYF